MSICMIPTDSVWIDGKELGYNISITCLKVYIDTHDMVCSFDLHLINLCQVSVL